MIGLFGKKEVTFQEIKDLYLKGQVKKAISSCEDYLKKNPNDFDALNLLGEMYYKTGDKNKFISLSLELVKRLENERYYEKAAAVLRKGIKYYPDYHDFYRYLAKIFATKGLIADQIGVLKELANVYERSGEVEKFLNTLSEIFELDKQNYNFIKYLYEKLKIYKKTKDVCKYLQDGLEVAKKNNDSAFLNQLIEDGIANKCVFGKSVKYTLDYFKNNRDKINIFIKEAGDYLLKEFDTEIFYELVEVAPYDENRELYLDLYHKYCHPDLFAFMLPKLLDGDTEKITLMFDKLKEFRDKKIDKRYADIFYEHLDKLPIDKFYDNLLLIAKLADHDDLKSKVVSMAGKPEEVIPPKTTHVLDLDLLDSVGKTDESVDSSLGINLLERTEYSEFKQERSKDIGINLKEDKYDIELDLSEFDEVKKEEVTQTSIEKDILSTKTDSKSVEDIFEIDLSEHAEDTDVATSSNHDITQEHLEDLSSNFFDDIVHKEPVDEIIKVDFSSEIREIEELIATGKYEYARVKLEDLLLLDPENEELKDLAVKVYSVSTFDTTSSREDTSNILNLDQDTKKVIKAIKESIEKTVSHDDYEMHYDLAQAYMEMELFEEAIEELKKSAYGKFKYKSFILMVECYRRMQKYSEAIDMLKLIILDFGKDNEILKNAMYELGSLYELMGDLATSKSHFMKLLNIDPEFRDVKMRIESLNLTPDDGKSEEGEESSDARPTKKKKISFM